MEQVSKYLFLQAALMNNYCAMAGLYLGSVMVTATNVGPVAVLTPWLLTITNKYYAGVSQAFGLSQPHFVLGGTLTGTAGDYWDVLWPGATNSVSVGFIVLSRSPDALQPDKVTCASSIVHLSLLPLHLVSDSLSPVNLPSCWELELVGRVRTLTKTVQHPAHQLQASKGLWTCAIATWMQRGISL